MTDPSPAPARPARSPQAIWGFAPLIVGVALAILVVVFAPSVAPEVVVVRPGDPIPATTSTSTSSSPAPMSTSTVETAP